MLNTMAIEAMSVRRQLRHILRQAILIYLSIRFAPTKNPGRAYRDQRKLTVLNVSMYCICENLLIVAASFIIR